MVEWGIMLPYFLGIDVALRRTGIVAYDFQQKTLLSKTVFNFLSPFTGTYDESCTYQEAFEDLVETKLLPELPAGRRCVVVVELLPRRGHYKTALKIQACRYLIYSTIRKYSQEGKLSLETVLSPNVFDWKGAVVNRKNATKEQTSTRLYKLSLHHSLGLPVTLFEDVDLTDAFGLALYGALKKKAFTP